MTYIKENIITELQKLYSTPRKLRAINKSPVLFLKKPLCMGNLSPHPKYSLKGLAIPPLNNGLDVLSSASDKTKLYAKNLSKNSNPDDSCIALFVFPSRINLKLHNILITPKMVKKVITNLDSSNASSPDCI